MKKILYFTLKILAKKVIGKYRPLTIAITGSFGKTSTKEAIYAVLRNQRNVRCSQENYNNEIGVPLTILGCETGGKSLIKWLKVFGHGLKLIINKDKDYPNILILEMGAEKVGDIRYLTKFVPVDIGVITGIGPVHLEFFGSLENIIKEKFSLVSHFRDNTKIAVLNTDDVYLSKVKDLINGRVITYGFSNQATYQAVDIKITQKDGINGTIFKLLTQGKAVPVFLPNIFGRQQVYAVLPALTIADSLYGNLLETISDLNKYHPPKGRTNLIKGIKNTMIIDDTYNSSPPASIAALDILHDLKIPEKSKKIAVFGEMLELGSYSEAGHQEVGKKSAEAGVDMLVAVGERARDILRGAVKAGLEEEKTFYFDNNHDAGIFVQNKIHENDLILIKGSQGARMEQVTKELMAEPLKAGEWLVRQSEEWLRK